MLPAAERITLVLEAMAIAKKVMVGRVKRSAYWLNHDPSGLVEAGLRSGDQMTRWCVRTMTHLRTVLFAPPEFLCNVKGRVYNRKGKSTGFENSTFRSSWSIAACRRGSAGKLGERPGFSHDDERKPSRSAMTASRPSSVKDDPGVITRRCRPDASTSLSYAAPVSPWRGEQTTFPVRFGVGAIVLVPLMVRVVGLPIFPRVRSNTNAFGIKPFVCPVAPLETPLGAPAGVACR
jgi:hypothetical protein